MSKKNIEVPDKNKLLLNNIDIGNIPTRLLELKTSTIQDEFNNRGKGNIKFEGIDLAKNISVDDQFIFDAIYDSISFKNIECDDGGDKLKTLILELSKWKENKKINIGIIAEMINSYSKEKWNDVVNGLIELKDINFLTLENLKEIMSCVQFDKDENVDNLYLYYFLETVISLLYGQELDKITEYIIGIFNFLGYNIKTEENRNEGIFEVPDIQSFYENMQNCEEGSYLLECIKMLGFELKLNDNHSFVLKEVEEFDKLIADIGYAHAVKINNWVQTANTQNTNQRKEITKSREAVKNYLKINNFNDFKSMKKNSILRFIQNSGSADKLKVKYQVLLEKENQSMLDKIILNKETVDWMLQNVNINIFDSNNFDELIKTIKELYEYTYELNKKIHPIAAVRLIASFKKDNLTGKQMNDILELVDLEFKFGYGDKFNSFDLQYIANMFLSLEAKTVIPEQLLKLVIETVDFERISWSSSNQENLCCIIVCLIEHSQKYNENNPKEAIEDVFSGSNDLLNKLTTMRNAKKYLNDKNMREQGDFSRKLADMLKDSGPSIFFSSEKESDIYENESIDEISKHDLESNLKIQKVDEVEILGLGLDRKNKIYNMVEQEGLAITNNSTISKNSNTIELNNQSPVKNNNRWNKYILYILGFIIAGISIVSGFYVSLYAFLGLLISLVLFFIPCFLKPKSQGKIYIKNSLDNSLSAVYNAQSPTQNSINQQSRNIHDEQK